MIIKLHPVSIRTATLSMKSLPESSLTKRGLSVSFLHRLIVSRRNSTVPFWQCSYDCGIFLKVKFLTSRIQVYFYKSSVVSSNRKSSTPIYKIPSSSNLGTILFLTITTFLNESPVLLNDSVSCTCFSFVSTLSAD